jgi:hypothetical protein
LGWYRLGGWYWKSTFSHWSRSYGKRREVWVIEPV